MMKSYKKQLFNNISAGDKVYMECLNFCDIIEVDRVTPSYIHWKTKRFSKEDGLSVPKNSSAVSRIFPVSNEKLELVKRFQLQTKLGNLLHSPTLLNKLSITQIQQIIDILNDNDKT